MPCRSPICFAYIVCEIRYAEVTMHTHLISALWACASDEAVCQKFAGGFTVELLALLLHQLMRILQLVVDAL